MTIALRFVEWMEGFVGLGEHDFDRGYAAGARNGSRLAMRLTLSTADLDAFMRSRDRLLDVEGEISYPPLGGTLAAHGTVNQLIDVGCDPRHKTMPYRLEFTEVGGAGRQLVLVALKRVDPPLRDSWRDTTTLFVRVLDSAEQPIGAGIAYIRFSLFIRQFPTYRCSGGTVFGRALAPPRFYGSFIGKLWEVYGFHLRGGR